MKTDKTVIRVRYSETDAMGFAYHSHHLSWFEVGRTELLRKRGYPYRNLEENNFFMPVIEMGCRYHAPAKYDDLLEVETELEGLTNARIKFKYKIKKLGKDQLIATGFTLHACTDEKGSPKRVPPMIKELIRNQNEDRSEIGKTQ